MQKGFLICASMLALSASVGCSGGAGSSIGRALTPAVDTSVAAPVQQAGTTTGTVATMSAATAATAAAATGTYPATVLADGPIAFYPLSDTTSVLTDHSGNGLNGVYGSNIHLGTPSLTSDTADTAATFPGAAAGAVQTADVASVLQNTLLQQPLHNFSVEAWIAPATLNLTGNYVPFVAYGREVNGEAWVIQSTPQSNANFYVKVSGAPAGSYQVTGATKLSPGQTYHIIATYDGVTARIYVNGNLDGSAPASGNINYAYIQPQWGLGIGAALGSNRPAFNGVIGDVSVYAKTLSGAQVTNHYLTGNPVPLLTETPMDSDAFVDTIGVVTHMHYQQQPYYTQWSQFESLLVGSGIRHIGDLMSGDAWYVQRVNSLGASGVHVTLDTQLGQTQSTIASEIPLFTAAEAVEAPNEPDLSGDPTWAADTIAMQKTLWSVVKGTSAFSNLTVIGPAVVSIPAEQALGDLSSYMDWGNMHDYFSDYNPGTPGWGSTNTYGTYGSIPCSIHVAQISAGSKPVAATETGWSDYSGDASRIDDRTGARYINRLYFDQYMAGVPRTLAYEFYDENPNGSGWSYFGLVTNSGTPKPSYMALSGLIKALADPGARFATSPLNYRIGGSVANLRHFLMQRRDGSYQLALWLEVPSYDPNAHTDINVPAQSITVTPVNAPTSATLTSFDDGGNASTAPVALSSGSVTLSISDKVSILTFH